MSKEVSSKTLPQAIDDGEKKQTTTSIDVSKVSSAATFEKDEKEDNKSSPAKPAPAIIEDSDSPTNTSSEETSTEVAVASIPPKESKVSQNENDNALAMALLASSPMTYENTKKSKFYTNAKGSLQTGDFEAALAIIESGITSIMSTLPDPDEMHECIAPLYYLYGTTLLYSIEESQENPENSLMASQVQQEQQQQEGGGDSAGDLEIAWENLETARSILSRCCGNEGESTSSDDKLSVEEKEERTMDLAQIYARLGDLSRHDGHFDRAINDYETCCESRREVLKGNKVWDRKIADIEYSLGITCLSLAAEAEKKLLDEMDDENKKIICTAKGATAATIKAQPTNEKEDKVNLSPEQITALREKSVRHYVQCSRILAGLIGVMCDRNPSEIAAADSDLETTEKKCAPKSNKGTKTTGLDENVSVPDQASVALSKIRERVSELKPTDAVDSATVHDLREMLDEIQETIDNFEKDREGLRDLSIMRKKAEEEANESDEPKTKPPELEETGTTTIGFGAQESPTFAVASASGGGFAAAKSISVDSGVAAAAPMMVIKKKKKKRDQKQSTGEESSAKRVKT
jgi:hypothetical protein